MKKIIPIGFFIGLALVLTSAFLQSVKLTSKLTYDLVGFMGLLIGFIALCFFIFKGNSYD